jgi:hypothetical protein
MDDSALIGRVPILSAVPILPASLNAEVYQHHVVGRDYPENIIAKGEAHTGEGV